ncbi:MAG: DUF4394 domain-containing protein [Hymenobacter sp.]
MGFDFNPTVDRVRVEGGSARANYRLNPNNGAIAFTDGNVSYATLSASLVASVVYTNSYAGSTSTTYTPLMRLARATGC